MSDDSACGKNVLCDFSDVRDMKDAQVEVCVRCGKRVVYKKGNDGRIDNRKYLRDHIRYTIQPFGKTRKLFFRIYGEGKFRDIIDTLRKKKTKKEIQSEWEQVRREIARKSRIFATL